MICPKSGMRHTLLLFLWVSGALLTDSAGQGSQQTYYWSPDYSPFQEGQLIGGVYWRCLWLGFGTGSASGGELWLRPKAATNPSETHSALVRSEFVLDRDWDIRVQIATDAQLRTKRSRGKQVPAPNPWEVGWLVANMKDDGSAGLYFILKTNGVELGAYRETGEQFFLYTATRPKAQIGIPYQCRLVKAGNKLTAFVGTSQVGSALLDALGNWPLGNRIGLYTEDAAVRFGTVWVSTGPGN